MLENIIKYKESEILEKIFCYLKVQPGLCTFQGKDYLWKQSVKKVSNLICKISEENNQSNCFYNIYEQEFIDICGNSVNHLLKEEEIHVSLKIILNLLQIYRKAYLTVLFDEAGESAINYEENFKFIVSFFDELECVYAEIWSKTSESEIKFKALTELDYVFVFIYDEDECIYLNEAAEKFIGYTKDEMRGKSFKSLFHKDYRNLFNLKSDKLKEKGDVSTYEMKIITKSGKEKWIEFSKNKVKVSDKTISIGIAFDINKRKKAENDLKRSDNRYRKLIELMPDGVLVHVSSNIEFCNNTFAKLVGYNSLEEVINKNLYDLIDTRYKDVCEQRMERARREGSLPLSEEKFIRKLDNKLMEIETTCALVPYKDGVAILEILRDISERKRIEELKEKIKEKTLLLGQTIKYDKIKNEFFANISHELKTPVNVIFSALQVIELYDNQTASDGITYNRHKYLNIMKQNCYRLVRIVNNLIDITKMDAGYYEISLCNCNIIEVIENITLSVADYIENRGIQLIFDTDVEERVMACDPDKIERILLNLLSNAVKFTPNGGKIFVNVYNLEDKIYISVKDTGIGIPKEKQKDVFNRFTQVDKSLSRNREGSGIGLSLVSYLVKLHEGEIHLNSEEGKGSEFIIELPVKVVEEDCKCIGESKGNYSNIERIHIEFSDIYK